MKVAVFSTKSYGVHCLAEANDSHHDLTLFGVWLVPRGFDAVRAFVKDDLWTETIQALSADGVLLIVLRSAGFGHVDLAAADAHDIAVGRVPAYSPYVLAAHTLALILTLNRNTHRAYTRICEGKFTLEGLLVVDIHGKTVGIIGTGKIGEIVARTMSGFGSHLLAPQSAGKPGLHRPWCSACGFRRPSRTERPHNAAMSADTGTPSPGR